MAGHTVKMDAWMEALSIFDFSESFHGTGSLDIPSKFFDRSLKTF